MRPDLWRRLLLVPLLMVPPTALASGKMIEPSAKDYYNMARYFLAAGRGEVALRNVEKCLQIKPQDKNCNALLPSARASALHEQFQKLSTFDLPGRRAAIDAALALDPKLSWAQVALAENEQTRKDVTTAARAFLATAGRSDAPPIVGDSWPPDVVPYVPFLPELQALQEAAVEKRFRAMVTEATTPAALGQVFARLEPYRSPARRQLFDDLTQAGAKRLTQEVSASVQSADLAALRSAMAELERAEKWAPPEALKGMRRTLAEAAGPMVQARIPRGFPRGSMAAARVAAESLLGGSASFSTAAGFPWQTVLGTEGPVVPIRISHSPAKPGCDGLDRAWAGLIADLGPSLSPTLAAVDGTPVLVFEIGDISCRTATQASDVEELHSTYVASYQQVANSEYVQLQSQLQVAMVDRARAEAEAAANPNFATSFAVGYARGKVSNLQAALASTPPFRQIPVELPYAAYKTKAVRTSTVAVSVKVLDSLTGFTDTTWVQEAAEATGTGVRGAMPQDSNGLQNREPSLPDDATLATDSWKKAVGRLGPAFRAMGSRALLARAAAGQKANQTVDAIGYLLLARDCGARDDLGQAGAVLDQVRTNDLAQVSALRLPPVLAPSPKAAASAAAPEPGMATRLATIQKALASVVTVHAGGSVGSGFFISSKGLVVTNAHVVDGATKVVVGTQDGESFLAAVVKLARDPDLALLRVAASDTPALPLASDELAPIGSDVIAVGSPLGLEGTVTRGILSAIRRKGPYVILQMDAPISPGNSGGPLLSEDGRVLGVNTSKIARVEAEGMGFSVAVTEIRKAFAEFLDP